MKSDAQRSNDQLDDQLAALDENSAAGADSTLRNLHAELKTLADDLRQPPAPDPHAEESAFQRAFSRVRDIGRDPSPQTLEAAAAEPDLDSQTPAPLGDVGPYKLLAKLGQGGMGTVYKALHTRLGKVVALKVLPTDRMDSTESIARFEREMKAVGQLDHPHIVRAMDAGEVGGTHFLVMEYVVGSDLRKLLKRNGPLPVAEACELVRQAAIGLQAAHSRGMVHRDIKPANLMLAAQEFGPPVVKVLDLGLARLSETRPADAGGLTGDGQIMGTIDYMAPEQAGDSHAVDIRADVYSLGATLYALLTGGSIFRHREFKTVMQKLSALATETVPPLLDRRPDVPAELSAVVGRMLSRDPTERHVRPAEVAAALEPFAADANLTALLEQVSDEAEDITETVDLDTQKDSAASSQHATRPAAAVERLPRPAGGLSRRRRGVLATAALAGMVLLGAIVLSLRTPHGEVVVELGDGVPAEMAKQLKIEIRGNGDVQIADAGQGWTIDVKEGKYTAELAGGNDRFQLDKQRVTVTRGKQTFVRVTLKPADKIAAKPPATAAPGSPWQPTAEQQAFFEAVAKLQPAEQVEAVRKQLMEVNPEFDGTLTHEIAGRRVVALSFFSDEVTSIWPVRALADLETLDCHGSAEGKGKLSDLAPLQGLPLTDLRCYFTGVSDLSPLNGMKLRYLNCGVTRVSDLSPLQGMPLRTLGCYDTRVSDLSPLQGIKLTYLDFNQTTVSDLSPLQDMPLTHVYCGQTRVSDLSPLKGMPLTALYFNQTTVSDLSPLQNMPLTHVYCGQTRVSDLSPLRGMKLAYLECSLTRVSDLSPLKGMPLAGLNFDQTTVSDLSPLKGMPLTSLTFYRTSVSDLSPLRGLPLASLNCSGTRLFDLSPLKGLPLKQIRIDERLFDAAEEMLLRSLSLTVINDKPAAEFWQEFEERRQAAEIFAAETAKLPAEQQVAAVVAKLEKLNGNAVGPLGRFIENDAVTEATLIVLWETTIDVTPLRAFTKLEKLALTGGPSWLDLSAVNSLPLEELTCTADIAFRNALVLRDMPTLQTINGQPAGEYLDSLTKPPSAEEPKTVAGRVTGSPWEPTPEQQAFFDAVAKVQPAQQVEAVRKQLMEVNPEFDGKLTHEIAGRRVVALSFFSDEVTSIWPVRALADLETLDCHGSAEGKGKLSDLAPLQGLPLTDLRCYFTGVSDLSPLNGMKLRYLNCGVTRVSDLSPLRRMPLKVLNCRSTPVSDLSPLEDMGLTNLDCIDTRVSDLWPLQGMKLAYLQCSLTRVSDLSPLKGMPLIHLDCAATGVSDLSPLQGMPLTNLRFNQTTVSDLSPLQDMPLTHVYCGQTRVSDLSPLQGMKLAELECTYARVSDLSPLKGMPLMHLSCSYTGVSDLSPLKGMPLTSLTFYRTSVSDLSPLRGLPLASLNCSGTRLFDLSPLKGLPLKQIRIDERLFDAAEETLLRSLSLPVINDKPAAEFWQEFEERRQAAEIFAAETAKLPAEQQVAAVVAKLEKLNGNAVGPLGRFIENDAVTEATLIVLWETTIDVTPLRAFTKLEKLALTGGPSWLDLSAVNSLPLEELTCTADIAFRNAPVLRDMPTLKTINGQPAGEYLDSLSAMTNDEAGLTKE